MSTSVWTDSTLEELAAGRRRVCWSGRVVPHRLGGDDRRRFERAKRVGFISRRRRRIRQLDPYGAEPTPVPFGYGGSARHALLVVRAEGEEPLDLAGDHEPRERDGGHDDVRVVVVLRERSPRPGVGDQ